jgi:mono/diheme cytochrome c family protein
MKVGDELAALLSASEAAAARAAMTASLAADPESLKRGAEIYTRTCMACHQANGLGLPGVFPPMAGAEQLLGDVSLPIKIVLHGLHGPITVKGQVYQAVEMPPQGASLKDQEVADVLTYARQSFGNTAAPVSAAQVQAIRTATAGRTKPFTTEELGLK